MINDSIRHRATAGAALLALLMVSAGAMAQWPAELNRAGNPTLAPLLARVTPAVVNISVTSTTTIRSNPLYEDPFFRRFFNLPDQPQERRQERQSAGSGVVIDAEQGYVLTNHHVIANADAITVTLQDRRRFEAELVGSDAGTDIALLKIPAERLTALELGDSGALEVGDFVVAIGNPFGLGQTVTSGIVSALGRSGLNLEGYEDFIQTDASINPGNSGGALVDLDGRLVGINTAIIAPAGGNVGIGFAVPTHMAKAVTDQLLEYGEVRRGRLGIGVQDVTPDLSEALKLSTVEGAVVTQVEPGSAAEAAGIEAGDVITAVDGRPVTGAASLRNLIGLKRLGESARLAVLRDGRQRTLEARIGEAAPAETARAPARALPRLDGAEFGPLDRNHPQYGRVEGVLVTAVEQGSPAWRNGLRTGDIVLSVNRRPVAGVAELSAALEATTGTVALQIVRNGMALFLVIQ